MAERLRIFDPAVDQIVDMTEYHLQKLIAITRAYGFVREGRDTLETIDKWLKADLAKIERQHRAALSRVN